MILKPIKDEKIDEIFEKSKSYKMKSSSKLIMEKFESSNHEVKEVSEVKNRGVNKKFIYASLCSMCALGLVIAIPLSITLNKNSISTVNISSNNSILSDVNSGANQAISKEMVIFSLNSDELGTNEEAVKEAYRSDTSISDSILSTIEDGFKRVFKIFVKKAIDASEVEIEYEKLDTELTINGYEFDSMVTYSSLSGLLKYYYLYNSDGSLDFGYLSNISPKYTFLPATYYKVSFKEVDESGQKYYECDFSTVEESSYFRINNKISGDYVEEYTYSNYSTKDNLSNGTYEYFSNITYDSEGKSNYSFSKYNDYIVKYLNISLDLLKFTFEIQYEDLINKTIETYNAILSILSGDDWNIEII